MLVLSLSLSCSHNLSISVRWKYPLFSSLSKVGPLDFDREDERTLEKKCPDFKVTLEALEVDLFLNQKIQVTATSDKSIKKTSKEWGQIQNQQSAIVEHYWFSSRNLSYHPKNSNVYSNKSERWKGTKKTRRNFSLKISTQFFVFYFL